MPLQNCLTLRGLVVHPGRPGEAVSIRRGNIAFPWYQDIRPTPAFSDQLSSYVQTIIAVDEATTANGCLHIVPGSHKLGDLKTKRYAERQIEEKVDVSAAVPCHASPGDVILFTSYTVHGSTPNTIDRGARRPRRSSAL